MSTFNTVAGLGAIKLRNDESQLFTLLLNTVKWKGRPAGCAEDTVLRVAGGWVRDKIMNGEGKDIDIALNNQSGVEFAHSVNEYLQTIGHETRTIAVIQANPDQSKHLETANLRVLGFEIDCVNLRAETYTDESRIPEITFGSPLQDALRRDFTINSLFYNLNTGLVEDFTGRGLLDIERGIVRTPIDAHITFKDDPLRVLRAIRFSSRLNFALDTELVNAARTPEIIAALCSKVSRERVYKEVEGMMNTDTSRPYLALAMMDSLKILDAVLPVHSTLQTSKVYEPTNSTAPPAAVSDTWSQLSMETVSWVNTVLTIHMQQQQQQNQQQQQQEQQQQQQQQQQVASHGDVPPATVIPVSALAEPKLSEHSKVLFLAAALSGVGPVMIQEKKKVVPLTTAVLRDGFKMDTHSLTQVQSLLDCMHGFIGLANALEFNIDIAGKLLRENKELWRDCITLACAYDIATADTVHSIRPDAAGPYFADVTLCAASASTLAKFRALERTIVEAGLDHVWLMKPLLNGNELMTRLQLPKGPMIGVAMEHQITWQIRTRSSNVDECLAYLQSVL